MRILSGQLLACKPFGNARESFLLPARQVIRELNFLILSEFSGATLK